MSKKARQHAAGAVVLRTRDGVDEVLLVHRPKYKDWSLPKGKPFIDEPLPATAVREVLEETGVSIHLGVPLGTTKYTVGQQPKAVHWWLAHCVAQRKHRKDSEVDKVRWFPVDQALKKLSYANERPILRNAMDAPRDTGTLLVVRHGKAMLRKHWSGRDDRRPIGSRGRQQARNLVPLLAAYGVDELASSWSTRCMQTLDPAREKLGLPVTGISLLSEEEALGHSTQVQRLMRLWARELGGRGGVMAVCGHRPVLPDMRLGLGVPDKPMLTAETLVVHLDGQGRAIAVETHKSTF